MIFCTVCTIKAISRRTAKKLVLCQIRHDILCLENFVLKYYFPLNVETKDTYVL